MKLHKDVTDKRTIKRFQTLEKELKEIHNNFYDYSISVYVNNRTKFEYICPKHGIQEITASNHLKGKKCKYCYYEKAGDYHKLNKKDFLKKAIEVHGKKYGYEKVIYKNIHTPVIIRCKKHGEWEQSPNNHLRGHGCEECAGIKQKTTKQFIKEAKEVHGDTYSYDHTKYKSGKEKVVMTCKVHGNFKQYPNAHLKGHGCEKCSFKLISETKSLSREEFIARANIVHENRYNYEKVVYVNAKTSINIFCEKHGFFTQTPDSHLRGAGCPGCAEYGFDPNKSAILYYLKIKFRKNIYYKIGITNNDVKRRFKLNDRRKIQDYIEIPFEKGIDALEMEKKILKKFIHFIETETLVFNTGNTEIFFIDVIGFNELKNKPSASHYLEVICSN